MKKVMIALLSILLLVAACATSEPAKPVRTAEPVVESTPVADVQPTPVPSAGDTQETVATPAIVSPKVVTVSITGFKFVPADVTVNVGDTITWTNADGASHTVESADGVIESDELFKGDTFSMTFDKAGSHPYICGLHPSMKGTVTVVG